MNLSTKDQNLFKNLIIKKEKMKEQNYSFIEWNLILIKFIKTETLFSKRSYDDFVIN